ncbi:glycosyltransferase family 4 protein [Rhizobium sp. SL42]|uniref:glycosyltransferase family 4 protein n=1 Tax=Rhizobium sp. SL42 TaxID=2806346 RepID=UPI001F41CF4F|nr:glycosyltransferase family 4 protein [Rhizobium sp. SL42]UJW75056.1 glycosyltransferase family 4 protein [Rhizobium sp. SL42]
MKIAFYSPLKSPDHPVPSGDRLMARQLIRCLTLCGHSVEVVSQLRAFIRDHDDRDGRDALLSYGEAEVARLREQWHRQGAPDLWFCYHPYYKSPDLLGPALCASFALPYVTVEASYSHRRNIGVWSDLQDRVLDTVRRAAVNICLTGRDRAGLKAAAPEASVASLKPFLDADAFFETVPRPDPRRLVTVAMMRSGDKLASYQVLAQALGRIRHLPWMLSIVGDGPMRDDVRALFSDLPEGRIEWLGQKEPSEVAEILAGSALYVWPGCGEAYGLAYLEAQAAGVPVIAWATAGVPEVVENGTTGILTAPGDVDAYAAAIATLLGNDDERRRMAGNARVRVVRDHSLKAASRALDAILHQHLGDQP